MERQRLHRLGRRLVELSRQVELAPGDVRPDPAEELITIFMTQVIPSTAYPVRRELRTMVYAAITDSNL